MKETQRLGSTRIMTPVEPGVIALQYTDRWSAFDRGSAEQTVPDMGKARCACAVKSFELAAKNNLPTHFIRQADELTIHVQEFSVPGRKPLSGRVHGRVIPLEWLWRVRAKGSLLERLASREITPKDLGFPANTVVEDGMRLPYMLLECTTKFEDVDRHLTIEQAMDIAELTVAEFQQAQMLWARLVDVTNARYNQVGFDIPDGKGELAQCFDGTIIGADVFGTPDENRIVQEGTGNLFSKDIIRNYLKTLPWMAQLKAAKKAYPKDKSKWPAYPLLPDDLVKVVSNAYKKVALEYAGVRI